MAQNVSPGIYTKIIDLTSYLQQIPGSIGFVSLLSRRGPDNEMKYITSLQEYADNYGRPNYNDYGKQWGQGPYVAWNHISVAPSCYVMRCLPDDAAYSNLFVYMAVDSTNTRIVTQHYLGMNSIDELETKLAQNLGPGDSTTLPDCEALTSDALSLKDDHSTLSDDETPNLYAPTTGDRVGSTSDNNIYVVKSEGNDWQIVGLTYLTRVNAITATDISTRNDLAQLADDDDGVYAPAVGDRVYSTWDNAIYVVQTSGTTWANGHNVVHLDTFKATYDLRQASGSETAGTYFTYWNSGIIATTSRSYLNNADSFYVEYDLTKTPGHKEVNAQYFYDEDDDELKESSIFAGTQYPLCVFYPVGRGDSYDDFAISLAPSENSNLEGVYVLNIWETQSDGDDVIIESFNVSFDEEGVDDSGDSTYIVDVLQRFSKYLRVMINDTNLNTWSTTGVPIVVGDSITPIHLYGGSEGDIIDVDSSTGKRTPVDNNIKTLLSFAYLGLIDDDVLDLDDIYMPLVYDAGYPTEVKDSIVRLTSELRLDGVAILDNGDNASVNEALAKREDYHTYNTTYASIFESFSKIFDTFTGKEIWVSPVYHMSTMIPLNDRLYEIWYPSAGFNRGTINGIRELRFNPKLTQRDQFYLNQINPIVKFSIGYTMWGNLTSQRKPTPLQDLNVIRTVLYIKRSLEQYLKFFLFEFNDEETWNQMFQAVDPFLGEIQRRRGLVTYSIDVGATEYEIKTKKAHVNVTLQPTRAIEQIELNLFVK